MFTFISKQNDSSRFGKILLSGVLALTLSACNHDDDDPVVVTPPPPPPPAEYSYSVTITNLTYAQPLSPLAVLLHGDNTMWMVGSSASEPLEKLAESGDSADLLAEAGVLASASDTGVLLPGASSSVTVSTTDRMATHFTSATMLVNTNDAFSGLTGVDISTLAVDESKSWNLNVYDSGTEANTEAMGTIPGPADGGAGFDAARDDVNFVAYHSGVVSQDDGLTSSVLTQAHRFDNPAIKLTITRTK
ncbi:MAG: spondin domain-containing protein [Colwellia sp.]|nr:spondin domain-containing protein [Colwellia sp.]MCW8866613.1 spondin domain-containing protein [Colwellia sp.]MCW9082460.1 spondin domain-containing protein [Colwellia sp.]